SSHSSHGRRLALSLRSLRIFGELVGERRAALPHAIEQWRASAGVGELARARASFVDAIELTQRDDDQSVAFARERAAWELIGVVLEQLEPCVRVAGRLGGLQERELGREQIG